MKKDLLQPVKTDSNPRNCFSWSKDAYPFSPKQTYSITTNHTSGFDLPKSQGKRKCYVQDVFVSLIPYLSEEETQKILYYDFYMAVYKRTEEHPSKRWQKPSHTNQQFSPYFVASGKNPQSQYSHIGMRQLMASQKNSIHLHEKDEFQIACAISYFFEEAVHISEQQNDTNLIKISDQVYSLSKMLPEFVNPNQREKTMVHISSLREKAKKKPKKLSSIEQNQVESFFTALLDFGFAFCSSKTW